MGEITPLFIFGMGRSGTTNALRVLNSHPDVMLNGEIPGPIMRRFFDLLDAVEHSYDTKDNVREGWYRRKEHYIYESFGALCKGGRRKPEMYDRARFRGHKTPRHEMLFEDYERHFATVDAKPLYFYCARNPKDCYRSYKATSWNGYKTVLAFLEHYTASFRQLALMQTQAPDRVFVLILDELIASGDALAFYRDKLFTPLGLEPSDAFARTVEKLDEQRAAAERPPPLNREETETIEDFPGIAPLYEAMFDRFKRGAAQSARETT